MTFSCSKCDADYVKWQGFCPQCQNWNTIVENKNSSPFKNNKKSNLSLVDNKVKKLTSLKISDLTRISTGLTEFDKVLGGGLVNSEVLLIGGDPGAGKSTLVLQILSNLAKQFSVLYVTGEETIEQIAIRAKRIGVFDSNIGILNQTNINDILVQVEKNSPQILVIDSIQVMSNPNLNSMTGGPAQVKEIANMLVKIAKSYQIITIIIGHITKEGMLAGPKVLEHCVDCFVMIEVMSDSRFRAIRSHKNRFGSVNELSIFAIQHNGLKQVTNPSAIFLANSISAPGSCTTALWEGTRCLLIEVQSLVDNTDYQPKRVSVGFDLNRVFMLLAICSKKAKINFHNKDVFINIVGGIKITETASDLALAFSLYSSLINKKLAKKSIFLGEIGLSGEIRPVNYCDQRLIEAHKHGFELAVIPSKNRAKLPKQLNNIKIYQVDTIKKALQLDLFAENSQ